MRRNIRIARYVIYKETLINRRELFWSFVGSFIGILLLSILNFSYLPADFPLLLGSFGATAVLLYAAIHSPLAQPRNLVGGHVLSALVGVSCQYLVGDIPWLAASLAVSLSIVVMQLTKTLHPPGGATALIATTGSESLKNLGFFYAFYPVFVGAILLLIIALIFNNITTYRSYPTVKWGARFKHWPRYFSIKKK